MEEDQKTQILLKQLELEWKDHFQTRDQSWRAIYLNIILLGGLITVDLRAKHILITIVVCIFMILFSCLCLKIVNRHFEVQRKKFSNIGKLEKELEIDKIIEGHDSSLDYGLNDMADVGKQIAPVTIRQIQLTIVYFSVFFFITRIFIFINGIYSWF